MARNRALPRAPGALPLLLTFPALVPEEGAFPGGSRAILKASRWGKAVLSRSAWWHRGGSAQRREPEEGHGAAAGLLSTGARAAGGTVSASKGWEPLTATWGTLGLRVARPAAAQRFPASVPCTTFSTDPSSLSSNILGSRSLSFSLPPLRLLFCE